MEDNIQDDYYDLKDYEDLKNFTDLFANSSSSYHDVVGLSMMGDFAKQFIPFVVSVTIFFALNIIVWACFIIKHNNIHRLNSGIWTKLPEFPTVNHAGYIMRIYYSGFIGLSLISLIISVFVGLLGGFAVILIIVVVIFILVAVVFLFVVTFFCKVYQVMISYEIIKICLENKTNGREDQITYQQQSSRKTLIKKLYITFMLKDCVLTPAIVLHEAYQSLIEMFSFKRKDFDAAEDVFSMSRSTKVAVVVEFIISFSVLLSFIYYVSKSTKFQWKSLNPLQRLLLSQAKMYSAIRVVSILVGGALLFIGWLSFSNILFLIQLPGILLPIIILITTVFSCRGRVGDIFAQGNDPNAPEHAAYTKF